MFPRCYLIQGAFVGAGKGFAENAVEIVDQGLDDLGMASLERIPGAGFALRGQHGHAALIRPGADFVRALRKTHPRMPVLVISGLEEAEQEYAELNVTFRMKPLLPDHLLETVRQLLGSNGSDLSAVS